MIRTALDEERSVLRVFRSSRSRPGSWWALCLIAACATAATERRPTRPAPPPPRPAVHPPGVAASPACEPLPPPPPPLAPLREFDGDEWTRIRRAQRYVLHAARDRDLSPSLLNGMIWVESKFDSRARGKRGPRGLLQLMPQTARYMARRLSRKYMPYSIDFNISAGAEYLTLLLEQFDGDLELALAAYNAGPAVVTAWQAATCPTPKPRQAYVAHVERAARAFCERLPRQYEPESSAFTCPPEDAEPVAALDRRTVARNAR